jgi:hypothetical protein
MADHSNFAVIPAQAGTHFSTVSEADQWVSACAGMTTPRYTLQNSGFRAICDESG